MARMSTEMRTSLRPALAPEYDAQNTPFLHALTTYLDRLRLFKPDRDVALDLAKGSALLMIMAIHLIPNVMVPSDSLLRGTGYGGTTQWGWPNEPRLIAEANLTLAHAIFHGKGAALFGLVAGMVLARSSRPHVSTTHATLRDTLRGTVITLIGLVLGQYHQTPANMLVALGVCIALATHLRRLGRGSLAVVFAVLLLGWPPLSYVLRRYMPVANPDAVTLSDFANPATALGEIFVTGAFPVMTWLTFVVAGLLLATWDLRMPRVYTGMAKVVFFVAFLATVYRWMHATVVLNVEETLARITTDVTGPDARLLEFYHDDQWYFGFSGTVPPVDPLWLTAAHPHTGMTMDVLFGVAWAAGWICCCYWLADVPRRFLRAVHVPIAALGSMSLTFYVAHLLTVRTSIVQEPVSSLAAFVGTWQVQVVVGLTLAVAWALIVRTRGPLELLVAGVARVIPAQPPGHEHQHNPTVSEDSQRWASCLLFQELPRRMSRQRHEVPPRQQWPPCLGRVASTTVPDAPELTTHTT